MTQVTVDKPSRNGVDTETLFATLDAVKAQPQLAAFQFRARNSWVSGTHSQGRFHDFYGAGQELNHEQEFTVDADHPAVLVGKDNGPTPVEFLLHALAACLTAGLVNTAAVRGVTLTEVESTVEGDIDLQGILGLDSGVRNGFEQIRVSFQIKGDADDETLRGLVGRSQARSAVYDIVTNGLPVTITTTIG